MGSIGHKRRPLLGGNYLEAFAKMSTRLWTDVTSTEIEIDYDRSTNFTLGANVNVPGVGIVKGDMNRDRMTEMDLRLINISVDNRHVMNSINAYDDLLSEFWRGERKLWKQRRVVNEVFTVVSGEISEMLSSQSGLGFAGTVKGIELDLNQSNSTLQNSTVTLPEGSTFAYLLFKPVWNAKLFRNIETVVSGRHDQWGTA